MSMIDNLRKDLNEFKQHREVRHKLKSNDFDLV
jgi:hypothetical protein